MNKYFIFNQERMRYLILSCFNLKVQTSISNIPNKYIKIYYIAYQQK